MQQPPQGAGYGALKEAYGNVAPPAAKQFQKYGPGLGGFGNPTGQRGPNPINSNLPGYLGAEAFYDSGSRLGLSKEQVDDAIRQFHECDTDHSGTVELNELENILISLLGPKMKTNLVKRLAAMHFSEADRDHNGHIDRQEFLEIYSKLNKHDG